MSGDGGDEAFAGYPKHRLQAWQRYSRVLSTIGAEGWTLDAMCGAGWRGTKLMSKLRRQLLAETPSLFSGEFFSGPVFQA